MKVMRFRRILKQQLRWYPELQIQDLYKLIYQGVMGSGHAISSPDRAESRLIEELQQSSEAGADERLFEEVSPDGEVIRVHLRPFHQMGGDPDRLLTAFIRTGREFRGSNELLITWWSSAAALQTKFSQKEMDDFIDLQRKNYFPAIHHSESYRLNYKPAYRVALKRFCLEEGVL